MTTIARWTGAAFADGLSVYAPADLVAEIATRDLNATVLADVSTLDAEVEAEALARGVGSTPSLTGATYVYANWTAILAAAGSWADGDFVVDKALALYYRYWDVVAECNPETGLLPAYPFGNANGLVTGVKRKICGFPGGEDPTLTRSWTATYQTGTGAVSTPSGTRTRLTAATNADGLVIAPPELMELEDTHCILALDSPYFQATSTFYSDFLYCTSSAKGGHGCSTVFFGISSGLGSSNWFVRTTSAATNTGSSAATTPGGPSVWMASAFKQARLVDSAGLSYETTSPYGSDIRSRSCTEIAGPALRVGASGTLLGMTDVGGYGYYSLEIDGGTLTRTVFDDIHSAFSAIDAGDIVVADGETLWFKDRTPPLKKWTGVSTNRGLLPLLPLGAGGGEITAVTELDFSPGGNDPIVDDGFSNGGAGVPTVTKYGSRTKIEATSGADLYKADSPSLCTASDTCTLIAVEMWGHKNATSFDMCRTRAYVDASNFKSAYIGEYSGLSPTYWFIHIGAYNVTTLPILDDEGQSAFLCVSGPANSCAITVTGSGQSVHTPQNFATDPTVQKIGEYQVGAVSVAGDSGMNGVGMYRLTVS